jgi:hypothetical protein
VSVGWACKEKVGYCLGDETQGAVGGRAKMELEKVRVQGEVGRPQLGEHAALRAAEICVQVRERVGWFGAVE